MQRDYWKLETVNWMGHSLQYFLHLPYRLIFFPFAIHLFVQLLCFKSEIVPLMMLANINLDFFIQFSYFLWKFLFVFETFILFKPLILIHSFTFPHFTPFLTSLKIFHLLMTIFLTKLFNLWNMRLLLILKYIFKWNFIFVSILRKASLFL